jgi:predicted transposase YdaD
VLLKVLFASIGQHDDTHSVPQSFVSRALRSRHLDLLFSVKIRGEEAYVYVLLEQQRKVEALMILRMGTYMWRAWERLVTDEPNRKQIPPILPVLIHHSETGWTAATSFHDIVAMPEARRHEIAPGTPAFEMQVVDLSPGQASHIVDGMLTAFGKMVLWCLSVAGDDERLQKEIGRMAEALDAMLAGGDAVDALHAILRYLLATHRQLGAPTIARMLETTASKGQKKVIMDELDAFRVEGRKDGRVEGRVEGRAKTLLEQLRARFGPVPADVKAEIVAAPEATLARWSLRVLTEPTLDSVLHSRTRKSAVASRRRRAPA